jgi:hypothetical protein
MGEWEGIAGVEKRGEDRRRERERGKRRCRESLGRSFRAKSTRASYTFKPPARSADTSIYGKPVPRLFSIFSTFFPVTVGTDRD